MVGGGGGGGGGGHMSLCVGSVSPKTDRKGR